MPTNAEAFFRSLAKATDIEQLIGTTEDLYFDAKTVNNESFKADSDQGALAKAISAFANSDGGVIVYGLEAKRDEQGRDVVQAAKPLADPALVQSKILGLVGQLLQPPVEGILAESRIGASRQGYVLVLVPPSDSGPHRARPQDKYYRRHGSASLPMEHYELEEMFGRRRRPLLQLYSRFVRRVGNEMDGYFALFAIGLKNTGRGIAKCPGLLLRDARAFEGGFDAVGNVGLPALPTSDHRNLFYGGSTDRVIYPGIELDVAAVTHPVEVPRWNQAVSCSDLSISYEIYAEDMPTIKGTMLIHSQEILDALAKVGM